MRHRLLKLETVLWFPVILAAMYLVLFLFRLGDLLDRLYWDSDAAVATVVAETAGHGQAILGHYGWFTSLWAMLATRWIPFHHTLWEVAPYFIYLLTMSGLVWVSWKVSGRWAAAMTATLAVAISPGLAYVAVSINFHTTTWVGTAVMATAAFWLTRRSHNNGSVIATAVLTIFAAAFLASDQLFLFVGLVPFAVAGIVAAWSQQRRATGLSMIGLAAVSVVLGKMIKVAMQHRGYVVWENASQFATTAQFWPNFGRLLDLIARLANGSYFYGAPVGLRTALSFLCALIVILALSCPFLVLRKSLRGTDRSQPLIAYAAFWSMSVVVTCLAYVFSSVGTQPGYYVIALFYAVIATAPLLFSRTLAQRAIAALGIGILAFTSLLNLHDSKTALNGGKPPISQLTNDIVRIADSENATKGYADYWDSSSLTWTSNLAVRVQPVVQCKLPELGLCPFSVNVNTSWFKTENRKSFLLEDENSMSFCKKPSDEFGPPSAVHVLAPGYTMYIYPYDVASKLDFSAVSWKP